ncbi:uncharacterized protein LOC135202580 isoform X2 [Macrobrachium nipponense]|uniref:uncharacterized protein LOC135202580 isoform X2 n=2 Tax=Macrobrachium nipponense TaxID=159736 RepID=UPI0030C83896
MMSGIQGIIVCGEASESDEEEEFCIVQAQGQQANDSKGLHHPIKDTGQENHEEKLAPVPHTYQQKKLHHSLLHQKLWETNASLERNLSKAFQEPLVKKTSHLANLITSVPAAQTSTLAANAAFNNVTSNLSNIDLMLQGLSHINAFETLKSQPSCSL